MFRPKLLFTSLAALALGACSPQDPQAVTSAAIAKQVILPTYSRWVEADRQLAAAEELVKDLCRECAAQFPDVEIVPEAIPVRAGPVLVDASRAASLVVVGSRGRDAFSEMLLGSVSQHVLTHAQCPVAIVR